MKSLRFSESQKRGEEGEGERGILFVTYASKQLGLQCNIPYQLPIYFLVLALFPAFIISFPLCFQFKETFILGVREVLILDRGSPAIGRHFVPDGRAFIHLQM